MGASVAEKWGWEIFWGKCLKITRLSDFLHGIVFPCMAHKFDEICRRYIHNPVIFLGEDNGIIYIAAKEVLSQATTQYEDISRKQ